MFYNSRNEKNNENLKKYLELTKSFYKEKENTQNIAFGYLDMGRNSHHAFKVKNEDIFLRLYKYSNFDHPLDKEIESSSPIEDQIIHFL